MKRAQGGLEAVLVLGIILIGALFAMNQLSSSTASLSKEKSKQSLENLADAIKEVQLQGSSAAQQVEVYIPPEVDADHTGKSETNTLVVALQDGSEIVVPIDSCLVGSLPNEPGTHTVTVKGGDCASLATDKFSISPAYVLQKLEAGDEASLPITIQTIDQTVVRLSSSPEIQDFIDLDLDQPAIQYETEVTSPTIHDAKIIIPMGAEPGIYEGYIQADTGTIINRISVKIEVYTTDLQIVTFKSSSRTEPSDKFDVYEGLYYRIYMRDSGELSEGNFEVVLENPSSIPVNPYPPVSTYTPTGIYDGMFVVEENLYNGVPGTELGTYTITVTDVDTGLVVQKEVEGMETAWLDLEPEQINEWMKPDTQLSTPITIDTPDSATVELEVTGDVIGLFDLVSSTPGYDSSRTVEVGEDPLVLNDVSIKVPEDQGVGSWSGTLKATKGSVEESIPVTVTVYSSDLGWKIVFEDLGATAASYSGAGVTTEDKLIIPFSSPGWKFTKTANCGKNGGSHNGYCKPTDAWGKCDNEPSADWNTFSFDDSSWDLIDHPAYSTNYNQQGNFICTDCTGFFRKYFSLTQEDIDTVTSVNVQYRADEGLQCFINGEPVGFTSNCGTDWLPKLKSYNAESANLLNALQVGPNVIACRLQERRKYSETYFKYFDFQLEVHKEIPPEDPLAEIEFKVLNQNNEMITGLDFNSGIELKKLDESPHPSLNGYFTVVEDSGVYTLEFSPSELYTLPQGGDGTYGFTIGKDYEGLDFDHSITFNINEPQDEFPWRVKVTSPTTVAVAPTGSFSVEVAILDQQGDKITGDDVSIDILRIDGTPIETCNPAPLVGDYYSCTISDIQPGQYWVQIEDRALEPRDLIHSFTFNAVST